MARPAHRPAAEGSLVLPPAWGRTPEPPSIALPPLSLSEQLAWSLQAFVSLVGFVLLSPVMVAIAVAIKLTSPGTVLYRGARVGRGERGFTIYKFRTMVMNAEQQIGARLFQDQDRDACSTRIGRLLKRSKLDELPQLFNVIRGDMRLAGPRPVRPVFLERFKREIPGYARRFEVPPGLTGIAQLRGGYYTAPRNKLRYDLVYIRNRSLRLDLKLILLTLFRIGDRWLRMGFWVLFLFLFVSFIPPSLQSKLYVSAVGVRLPLVLVFIVAMAARIFWRPSGSRISFFRGPLNVAAVLFVVATAASAAFSPQPQIVLAGAGYYVVTGFLWSLIIVNGLSAGGFATMTLRTIALTSVTMAILGLGDVVSMVGMLVDESFAGPPNLAMEAPPDPSARAIATLHNPTVLAVFLVLGIPLLFAEVTRARTQRERDFWLVCATLSLLGVLLTQSRVGLAALLAAGMFFFLHRPYQALSFCAVCVASVILLGWFGTPRFSLARMHREAVAWVAAQPPSLGAVPPREWLVGGLPVATTLTLLEKEQAGARPLRQIRNMHLTLAREYGVAGWLVTMWLVFSALAAMKRAHDHMTDERSRVILWAIMSCLVGFLVAMIGTNALHSLVLQIYFWSLLGIGLWTVGHVERSQKLRLVWRFGDPGD